MKATEYGNYVLASSRPDIESIKIASALLIDSLGAIIQRPAERRVMTLGVCKVENPRDPLKGNETGHEKNKWSIYMKISVDGPLDVALEPLTEGISPDPIGRI